MKLLTIILLLLISFTAPAQKGTYNVLQTIAGTSLDSLRPMGAGNYISRVEFHRYGVLLGISNFATSSVKFSDMERKNRGWNTYSYILRMSEQMTLQLYIAPYPGKNDKPQLVSAILLTTFPAQNSQGYQKYLFWDDQLMRNADGTVMQPDEKSVKVHYNFGG